MQQGRVQRQIELKYRHFEGLSLSEPIDWRQDPFESRNWVHHFLSLRWIEDFPPTDMAWILRDLFSWIDADDSNRQFLAGRRRDHTTAIRTVVLDRVSNTIDAAQLRERIIMEVKRGLDELVFSDTYKFGHNHGLLIDEAVLTVLARQGDRLSNERWLSAIFDRLALQIDSLFDEDGYSREHSVSYQEYNLATLQSIDQHLAKSAEIEERMAGVRDRISVIRSASRRLLRAALRGNGEYIPFGDSFRKPNVRILDQVLGSADPKEVFRDSSHVNCRMVAPVAGLGFYRQHDEIVGHWHFGMTSAHNLGSHKQRDELSIFVEHDGELVFDDGGYTDADDEMRRWCRSRPAHSTCTIVDENGTWVTRTECRPHERWIKKLQLAGYRGLVGRANFTVDGVLWRILLLVPARGLLVLDWCMTGAASQVLNHRFILQDSIEVSQSSNIVALPSTCLELVASSGLAAPSRNRIRVAGSCRSQDESRLVMDWKSVNGLAGFLLQPCAACNGALKIGWSGVGAIEVEFGEKDRIRLVIPTSTFEDSWELHPETLIID